jgi:hypothetical protein
LVGRIVGSASAQNGSAGTVIYSGNYLRAQDAKLSHCASVRAQLLARLLNLFQERATVQPAKGAVEAEADTE